MSTSIRIDHNVEMKTRDGTVLRADVTRPDGPGRFPAIVCRTPYDKQNSRVGFLAPLIAARHGYAYVRQDIRGRFASDGDWKPLDWGGIERPDGFDCIEWVASEPWCDGNVAMVGNSYEAAVQVAAAREQPPHLRAIAPAVGGGGFDTVRRNALSLESITLSWSALMALDVIDKRVARGASRPDEVADEVAKAMAVIADPREAAWTLPLKELPPLTIPGMPSYAELVEVWARAAAAYAGHEDRIVVPSLSVSGWYDTRAGAHQFRALRSRGGSPAARNESKLLFGPWGHSTHDWNMGEWGFGQLGAPEAAGVSRSHLDFFDRNVRGDDRAPVLPNVRFFMMGANAWKDADDWPPPGVELRRMFLRSGGRANGAAGDGRLSYDPPAADEDPDRYDYDPADPVPSLGARVMYMGGSAVPGPFDQARIERRGDVLVYTSAPLARPLDIAGDVSLRLFVASSARDTDFVAKLCDVDPTGVSCNIADGILRARYRDGWETPSLLEPGRTYELVVDLGPTAHRFGAGHCIRLQVTSSAFPLWERNTNTGNPLGEDPEGVVAHQTVHHRQSAASYLELPVVDEADVRPSVLSPPRRP